MIDHCIVYIICNIYCVILCFKTCLGLFWRGDLEYLSRVYGYWVTTTYYRILRDNDKIEIKRLFMYVVCHLRHFNTRQISLNISTTETLKFGYFI